MARTPGSLLHAMHGLQFLVMWPRYTKVGIFLGDTVVEYDEHITRRSNSDTRKNQEVQLFATL